MRGNVITGLGILILLIGTGSSAFGDETMKELDANQSIEQVSEGIDTFPPMEWLEW